MSAFAVSRPPAVCDTDERLMNEAVLFCLAHVKNRRGSGNVWQSNRNGLGFQGTTFSWKRWRMRCVSRLMGQGHTITSVAMKPTYLGGQ